ncbi:MAG: hypothetical protein HPY74_20020, partial [Firmicutes bacterium]|nr:hypothetical protein [Bacillota bacterium]
EQNQDIIIAIQDNGAGISDSKLNELNDMLKSTTNSGKGIGLAIDQSIAIKDKFSDKIVHMQRHFVGIKYK